ncbi:MAG: M48 family metallopeptidase [Oscillospiraceae bacterium]|nr:M48 family metallopeptidase [Oscillospiraceae bacterium]
MGYDPHLYIHKLDEAAKEALDAFPQMIKLCEIYLAEVHERAAKIDLLSSAIRLSENQMPEIYALLPPICEKLGIDVPALYYLKSKEINAMTGGDTEPFIVITSKMAEELPPEMIASALAHECGHIACRHSIYHFLVSQLTDGLDSAILQKNRKLRRLVTPQLVRGLLFWDRCSELSADRAAVLCDGDASITIDTLLKVHGYDKNINREAFMQQAVDLHELVNDSDANRIMELMLTKDESHPRLATRVYECDAWSKTPEFQEILDGTLTVADLNQNEIEEEEVLAAELSVTDCPDEVLHACVNDELERVNRELKRYTCNADKVDYAIAIGSGILAGAVDSLYVGKIELENGDDIINNFVVKFANSNGIQTDNLQTAIKELELKFGVWQDSVYLGENIKVSNYNHHLADLAHHPTPLGLAAAILVKFFQIGIFVNREGKWHVIHDKIYEKATAKGADLTAIHFSAVLAGFLNWLVALAEEKCDNSEFEIPKVIRNLVHLIASYPVLIEVIKCAENWFGHLVSDMAGSNSTAGAGMGIPGIITSLLYEIASLPPLNHSGLPAFLNYLYEEKRIDLRDELPVYKALGKQAIPVILNEIIVRCCYFVKHLADEITVHQGLEGIDWSNVIPFKNRTVDRMLMISSMTLNVADTADAAVRAAIESGGDWVLFAKEFVVRYNYVAAGRAIISIVKEVRNEKKEAQLIHEKMLLTQAQTVLVLRELQAYKAKLDERVSQYLAEDIEAFLNGFDLMNDGLSFGDSDLVIKGNVTIQRVLGREPQFTTQAEFDDLMDSDEALVL